MLAVEAYPTDIQDVSAIMTRFRDLDPDLFVGGGHYNDAVLFVNSGGLVNRGLHARPLQLEAL